MSNKKNRNPEKKERKRNEKQLQQAEKYHDEGEVHYNNARYDKTIECYTKVIELFYKLMESDYSMHSKNCAGAYNYRGIAYNDKGEFDLAIKDYDESIKLNPSCFQAYGNRGIAYRNKGEFDLAIKDYDKAIEINPNNETSYYNKGNALASIGEYEKSIESYNKAIDCYLELIKLIPNNNYEYNSIKNNLSMTHNNKCASLIKLSEYEEAIKCSNSAIEIDPYNAMTYYNKGLALAHLKIYEDAIEYFDLAIKLDPDYNDAYYSKSITLNHAGIALNNFGKYEEAIKCFDYAIEIKPNNSIFYNNKSTALAKLVEYEESKKLYGEWTAKANEYYKEWIEVCHTRNFIDYNTSMKIYLLQQLLLKQKDNAVIKKIEEATVKYSKTIVKFEHDKNEEKIKEYFTKDDNKKPLKRDAIGKIILYQYSAYGDYAKDNIKKEQIYFSDPSTFNDPFDPLIRVLDKEHSEGLMKLLNFRVSCLSSQIDNLLLWSHYANKHKGICIAYDISKLVEQDNIIFRKIEHVETFPKPQNGLILLPLQNHNNELDNSANLTKTFTQKQKVWDYEDEYRLILQTDKDFLQQVDIKEIYLGRNMPKEYKEFIKDMIKEMNSTKAEDKIQVYSMNISDDDIFQLVPTLEN